MFQRMLNSLGHLPGAFHSNIILGTYFALIPGIYAAQGVPIENAGLQPKGKETVDRAAKKGNEPTAEERKAIEEELRLIVEDADLRGSFKLLRFDGARASAAISGKNRVIYFSKQLIEDLKNNENKWIARLILAHEVGHHIYGHTLLTLNLVEKAGWELQADRYGGMAIAHMRGTFEQLKAGFMTFDEVGRGGYPPRDERLAAGRSGWLSVQAPHEQLSMRSQGPDGVIISQWRKAGLQWTEYINGKIERQFQELLRDDENLTLIREDKAQILMIPLTDGNVLSSESPDAGRLFRAVATVNWLGDANDSLAVTAGAKPKPTIEPVPVTCSKAANAPFPCASSEEKAAISALSEGRWNAAPAVIYPAEWRFRKDVTTGLISLLPDSLNLLARHNFKVTFVQGGWMISYSERRKLLEERNATVVGMVVRHPIPIVNGARGTAVVPDPAASMGVEPLESNSKPQSATNETAQPADGRNYVALRYIVFKGGKPCPDENGKQTQQCGKQVEVEGNIPIQDTPQRWSAEVDLDMQDESTAGSSDRILSNGFTCTARRSLSIEAFSATCQIVIEAMTRSQSWTSKIANAGLLYLEPLTKPEEPTK